MTTLFHVQTRGGKYSIALQQTTDGTYQIREYKHGQEEGCYSMGNANYDQALSEYNQRILDSRYYDSIFYCVKVQ